MNHIALFRSLSPLAFALLAAAPGCVAADGEPQGEPLAGDVLDADGAEAEAAASELSATVDPASIGGDQILMPGADDPSSAITLVGLVTGFYVPPHVGGDREFKGNGPNVSVQVELAVFNGNELWAAVTMDAKETKSDWTHAAGTAWYHLHTAKSTIVEVEGPTTFGHWYTDTDTSPDVFTFPPSKLVNRLDIIGDTKGDDAGTKTGVRVYFNPITIVTQ